MASLLRVSRKSPLTPSGNLTRLLRLPLLETFRCLPEPPTQIRTLSSESKAPFRLKHFTMSASRQFEEQEKRDNLRMRILDDFHSPVSVDRAIGDGAKQREESAAAVEAENEGGNISEGNYGVSSSKILSDRLVEFHTAWSIRAIGDGAEQHEESSAAVEAENEGGNISEANSEESSSKKFERDHLADAVSRFAESFKEYVQSKNSPKLDLKEVYDTVSKVVGLSQHQKLKALKQFIDNPKQFEMLKVLPKKEQSEWVLLCLE